MLTLRNIKVWDTDEVIDLALPLTPADRSGRGLIDETGTLADALAAGPEVAADATVEIDATGLTLAPGFADPHVHFRDPGQTAKETMVTGARAAVSGGYTNVLIMPNTVPAMDGEPVTAGEPGANEVLDAGYGTVIDYLQHYAEAHGTGELPVRYDLCVCASKGRAGREATELDRWRRFMPGERSGVDEASKDAAQLAHPVTAISDDGSAVTPQTLDAVFALAGKSGLPLIEHCEHHETGAVNEGPVSRELGVPGIPEDTELKIVARDIAKARETGVHVHFQHVSTAVSFEAIRKAKAEGLPVTCETAPHYLALSDEALLTYGTLAKMNPPLRSEADRLATIEAIADGTVDMIATDHAPHTLEEKGRGFLEAPNGIIGLECAYGVCHRALVDGGHISDRRLIELMSVAPERLMGHEATDVAALVEAFSEPAPNGTDHAAAATAAAAEPGRNRLLDLTRVDDPDAVDLVVLGTDEAWTVDPEAFHSKARNTPFGGWAVTGRPLATIVGSRVVFSRLR